jgi:hypothetical protein
MPRKASISGIDLPSQLIVQLERCMKLVQIDQYVLVKRA